MPKPTPQQVAEKNIKRAGGFKMRDGRWDMTSAVKRETRREEARKK